VVNEVNATNVLPSKHVVFTDFDGDEGILVDLNTKKYYQLNETAMLVWKGLENGKSVAEITEEVANEYEVTIDHATRSVERLLTNFQSYKLVTST
jgi:PHD/YefM family antitoxin component YafN of YafNO toxin-antitoxin module